MGAESAFKERAKEVRAYLSFLESLERMHLAPGRRVWRGANIINASRASALLMIYNAVEHGVREGLVSVRTGIISGGVDAASLQIYWRREVVRAQFHARMRDGTSHLAILDEVAEFLTAAPSWNTKERDLPFSGSVDHQRLIKLASIIGARWRPPKGALGGYDLQLVRQARNDLAHGEESFEDVGSNYTAKDLIDKFERVRKFMASYLRMIDRYAERSLWKSAA